MHIRSSLSIHNVAFHLFHHVELFFLVFWTKRNFCIIPSGWTIKSSAKTDTIFWCVTLIFRMVTARWRKSYFCSFLEIIVHWQVSISLVNIDRDQIHYRGQPFLFGRQYNRIDMPITWIDLHSNCYYCHSVSMSVIP